MIKFLVFFVLGAASVYFLLRAFVNSDPGKLSRIIKTIIIIIIVFSFLRAYTFIVLCSISIFFIMFVKLIII